ncbi:carboxypeptidase regulatory-like domain-containing protein [Paraflavitalea pollutisoli]|uniref:carboxypeptidase regulatory-like domain-containing protein n=1 Tax=Paraflavitalea pollutisoli TaxID=3034143 RepID=UPI0023EC3AC0|nr:carboxypeptidase regulatory-like domain-containing protein [Paraflavitalea sp. H1-2-19X]
MKKNTNAVILVGLLLSFVLVRCGKDKEDPVVPDPPAPGMVTGKVLNEYGQLLPGSVVTLQGNTVNTQQPAVDGEYLFKSLAEGSYNLVVKKEGYIETTQAIPVTSGDTLVKDIVLKAGTAFFNYLSDTVLMAHGFAASYTLKVSSNTGWVVTSANDWIVPLKTGYQGSDSAIVKIAASTLDTVRQGLITLRAGSVVKQIVVKQVPEIRLLGTRPLPGNLARSIRDSIELQFNTPVKITRMFAGLTTCQSDMGITYSGNKAVFSYACAALGGDYSFTIVTTNSMGDQYTFTTTTGFYNNVQKIQGHIVAHQVNDADHSYWIATSHPNALYKIDMYSFDILKRIDLPNEENRETILFTINPYNNKLYVAFSYTSKLYILNQAGATEQVMDMVADPARPSYLYNGPYIYPSKLVFTKSGKGMLWLGDISSYNSALHWFIDAADNHRIWYESLPGEASYSYNRGQLNFDQSKILLTQESESAISTYDPSLRLFTVYKPSNGQYNRSITPSRTNTDVFACQNYQQLIVNPVTGQQSRIMSFAEINTVNAMDFYYLPGKQQTIFYANTNKLDMVDFATGTIPVSYDAMYYITGTTATLDGRFIILYRNDGNYNGRLIQLPMGWFVP